MICIQNKVVIQLQNTIRIGQIGQLVRDHVVMDIRLDQKLVQLIAKLRNLALKETNASLMTVVSKSFSIRRIILYFRAKFEENHLKGILFLKLKLDIVI